MNYNILASSSMGNCTILEDCIAIDMGINYKALGDYANKIKLVLLTHKHSDHFNVRTISTLSKLHPMIKFACCEYLVQELANIVPKESIYVLQANKVYDLGICKLSPFDLVHDVPNCGWKVVINNQKAIYATDTRVLNVVAKNYDLYLIEANYIPSEAINRAIKKQSRGEYAYEIRAMNNHLSKQQCDMWLSANMGANSKHVYMHEHVERN